MSLTRAVLQNHKVHHQPSSQIILSMPKKLYKRSSKKGKGSRLPLYKNKRDTSHDDDCVTPAETSAVVMEEESVTRIHLEIEPNIINQVVFNGSI